MKQILLVLSLLTLAAQLPGATIDFATWAAAHGQSSYSNGGVTLSTNIGTLAIDGSGFGVNAGLLDYDRDEISSLEVARVSFDLPVAINEITISKLFPNEGLLFPSNERGQYRVNSGSWVTFVAQNPSGQLVINDLLENVSTLDFRPYNASILNVRDDFSVRSIQVVPEPGTWVMMIAGLGVAAVAASRRRNSL
jgi:hypothetical protein